MLWKSRPVLAGTLCSDCSTLSMYITPSCSVWLVRQWGSGYHWPTVPWPTLPPPGNKCGCWLLLCYPAKLNTFMLMISNLDLSLWFYELKISSNARTVIRSVKNCMHRQIALLQTSNLPSKCRWKWGWRGGMECDSLTSDGNTGVVCNLNTRSRTKTR